MTALIRYGAIAAALLLGACGTVGWGKDYQIEFANASSVTILSDPTLIDLGGVQAAAQAQCDAFRKDAVFLTQLRAGGYGLLRETSFRCVIRQ